MAFTSKNRLFTPQEDALLIDLKERQNKTWKEIKDHFPTRSKGCLQVRYCRSLHNRDKPKRPGQRLPSMMRVTKPAALDRGHLNRAVKAKMDIKNLVEQCEESNTDKMDMDLGSLVRTTKKMNNSMLSPPSSECRTGDNGRDNSAPRSTPTSIATTDRSSSVPGTRTPRKRNRPAMTPVDRTPLTRAAKRVRQRSPVRTPTAPVTSAGESAGQTPSAPPKPVTTRQREEFVKPAVQDTPASVWVLAEPISASNPPFPGQVPYIFLNPPAYMVIERTMDGTSYRMRKRRPSDGGPVPLPGVAAAYKPNEAPIHNHNDDLASTLSEAMSIETLSESEKVLSHSGTTLPFNTAQAVKEDPEPMDTT